MATEKRKKLHTRGISYVNDNGRKACWCWTRFVDGHRIRTFFATERAAVEAKAAAEAEAQKGADARRVFGAAAQREYDAAKQIIGGEASLVDIAMWWREHHELWATKSANVSLVVDKILANLRERNVSRAFYGATRYYLGRFAKDFGSRPISSFRGRELAEWILAWNKTPVTLADIRSKLNLLFNRARAMEYLAVAPTIPAELLPRVPPTPVSVYSVDDCEAIMAYLLTSKERERIPAVAIRMFCGLRNTEADNMRWEWVDEKHERIIIPAAICKTRDNWVLQSPALPGTIWKWLAVVPAEEKQGRFPALYRIALMRILAGAHVQYKKNGFRHTFCTMHISLENSAEKTALLLRHRGTQMLYRHYLAKLVPKEDAERFFAISPTKTA